MTTREKARRQKQREQAGKSKAEQRAASISAADQRTASILGGGKLLKFRHLKEKGIVDNWTSLIRWVRTQDFPPGRFVGRSRVWFDSEIEAWLASRPVVSDTPPRGGAKARAALRLERERAKAEARAP